MPRKRRGIEDKRRPVVEDLAERLADELRNERDSGQPIIDEQEFTTGKLLVTVIWDEWDDLTLEDRTDVILRAYELGEGIDCRERVVLASGLTVPEAYGAGMLPFQVMPVLRRGDAVTEEQCREAMIAEGASILLSSDKPQLRFASEEEAEAARGRLSRRLPQSDQVWATMQEVGKVDDWARR